MYGKYTIYFISLSIIGSAIVQNPIIEDMEFLLANPYWGKLAGTKQNRAVHDGGELCRVSGIIKKGSDGKIINESNIEIKIRQYYTMISCVYGDRLKVIHAYLHAFAQKQKQTKNNSPNEVLKKMKSFHSVFNKMKLSLQMLAQYYFSGDKKEESIMHNNHIERALDIIESNERINNIDEFIQRLTNFKDLLDQFEKQYGEKMNAMRNREICINSLQRDIKLISTSGINSNEFIKSLRGREKSIREGYEKDIECLGFGFHTNFGLLHTHTAVYVVKDSKKLDKFRLHWDENNNF